MKLNHIDLTIKTISKFFFILVMKISDYIFNIIIFINIIFVNLIYNVINKFRFYPPVIITDASIAPFTSLSNYFPASSFKFIFNPF